MARPVSPMWFHSFNAASPAEYLGWDDAFLELAECEGTETLWTWESPVPFVVVGYGQQIAREVDEAACERRGIPILRRSSGGGAVVQGPGCLNYGLALRIAEGGPLAGITSANQSIMDRNRRALASLLGNAVQVRGHTDLVFGDAASARKFSGNAQRRRRQALLFHGTILLDFDLPLIAELLRFPSAQPDYRRDRGHLDFVANTGLSAAAVIAALRQEWQAEAEGLKLPTEDMQAAVASRYGVAGWHRRR
jgi:lipoate---protein ligase